MPKISVIMPVYNTEKYLPQCLDSLINQTFTDIEIICIDDASDDKTFDVLTAYLQKDSRISIFQNQVNKGQAITRNIAMDMAKGDYIFFMDSDDYLMPDSLEHMYCLAKEHNADWVIGKMKAIPVDDTNKNLVKRTQDVQKYLTFHTSGALQINIDNFCEILSDVPVTPANCLYKRSFLNDNDLRFINEKCPHEDDGFFIKIVCSFPKLVIYDKINYFYYIRDNSTTANSDKNPKKRLKDLTRVVREAIFFISKKKIAYKNKLIKHIQRIYNPCFGFELNLLHLIFIKWKPCNKNIKVLFISLFRQKYDTKRRCVFVKILGMTIYREAIRK